MNLVCKVYYLHRESDITKERIQKILASGANVVLTTGGIDDLCLKYFVEAGALAVRRCKKVDLKRIAKATGGNVHKVIIGLWKSAFIIRPLDKGYSSKKTFLAHRCTPTDSVPEKTFLKKLILKKSADDNKRMKNYPACKELNFGQFCGTVKIIFFFYMHLLIIICNILFFFTATLVMTLSNLEGEETFEPSLLGHADEVVQERICDDELILIKG